MHDATCGDCGKHAKFHSSQDKTNQSTAANAFKVIKEIKDNYHFMFY